MSEHRMITQSQRSLGQIALLVVILALIGNVFAFSYLRPYSILRDLGVVATAYEQINAFYVDEVDSADLIDAAISGMADSLGDMNTQYFNTERLAEFNDHLSGQFVGIGAEVGIEDDRLLIIAPLDGYPAWRSGVLPGDIVLEIDGEDTKGMGIFDAIAKLKGEEGTNVAIKVQHTDGTIADITITREKIEFSSLRGYRRNHGNGFDYMLDSDNNIAYLRLTQFGNNSAEEVRERLVQLDKDGMRGLILDLRDNGGGLLDGAAKISDMFLTGGKTIVSTEGRAVPSQSLVSTTDTLLPDLPLVILVNENSASASEILAGAMLDNDRALIVGTRTYGKGSVQQPFEFGEGLGALKLTTAYWYLPSGKMIHRNEGADNWGVDPSPGCVVPMSAEGVRAMLLKRREAEVDDPFEKLQSPITPEWIQTELLDNQLAAGLQAMQSYIHSNAWPEVGISIEEAMATPSKIEKLIRRKQELQQLIDQIDAELSTLENSQP